MLTPRFRHPLARDIAAVLALKVAFIIAMALFLFPREHRPVVNPDVVARQLFGLTDTAVMEQKNDR